MAPHTLRDRVDQQRVAELAQRQRNKRLAWTLALAVALASSGAGCLIGAALGAMEGSQHGWLSALLDAAAGGPIGALAGLSSAIGPGILLVLALQFGAAAHQRRTLHSAFVVDLMDALQDDLHPKRKVEVALDLAGYDQPAKRTWSGRSKHGNTKHRYEDRWLDLRAKLVDGTRLQVVRRADVKTRKGSVMKEKRWVSLRIQPARQVRFEAAAVEAAALEAAAAAFHDPPEGLVVRVSDTERGVRIRVMQLDAPILADEVVALAEAVLATGVRAEPV
ncbi:MAG: hypothetical protein R3F59_11805 [Myxococcota bacterium]